MPSINMIAPRRAEKRRLEQAMRRLVVVILAELVFVMALLGWVFMKTLTTRASIAELNAQMQTLAPSIKNVKDLDKQTARLRPKVDLLSQAKTNTMRWYNTLDRLTESVPASTWLTRLSTSTDITTKALVLNINGMTSEQANVGETMMRLQANPDFKSVDLHYTQKGTMNAVQAIEFEIGASFASPAGTGSETTPQQGAKGVTPNGTGQS
jgi:Tfp pilus assembly protein PilN